MENKLTWWFVFEWGKPHRVILRSSLLRIHYYQNKWLQVKESQYLIVTYSWTLTSNTQLDLFCSGNLSFQCMAPSIWLTNCVNPSTQLDHQLEKNVSCKVLQFITLWRSWSYLVIKPYGAQTQQLLQELGQTMFPITLFFTLVKLCSCTTCVTF